MSDRRSPPRRTDLPLALAGSLALHGLLAILLATWIPPRPEAPPHPAPELEVVLTFRPDPPPPAIPTGEEPREPERSPRLPVVPPPRAEAPAPARPEVPLVDDAASLVFLLEEYRTGSWVLDSTRAEPGRSREPLELAIGSLNAHFADVRWKLQAEMFRAAYAKNFLDDVPLMR